MIPQGSSVFPTERFNNLADQINAVQSPVDLQALVDGVWPSIQAEMDGIGFALGPLKAVQDLMSLSIADLPSVITFLGDLKTVLLGPQIIPLATMTAQIAGMGTAVANLTTAVANANARLGSSVTPPPIIFPIP